MIANTILTPVSPRPLSIDFDAYTDGDNEFKKELIELMIDNLEELRQTMKQPDVDLYHKTCHKIKATVVMLADEEFQRMMNDLQVRFSDMKGIEALDWMCQSVIESLKKE
jgi:hypothetical protein